MGFFDDTSTTTSQTNATKKTEATTKLPSWMPGASKGVFDYADNQIDKVYTPYDGKRVADFGTGYNTSKSIFNDLYQRGSPNLDKGRALLDNIGSSRNNDVHASPQDYIDPNSRAAVDQLHGLYSRDAGKSANDFIDPRASGMLDKIIASPNNDVNKTATDYINPYTDAVLNPALRKVEEARSNQSMSDAAAATMAGAFGDPQAGLIGAQRDRDYNQVVADTTGRIKADAYDKGQAQANTVMARMMQVPGIAQNLRDSGQAQVNLARQGLGATARMGQDLLNGGLAQANTVMARMMQMPGQYIAQETADFGRDTALGKAFAEFGIADRDLEQKHLDVGYGDYQADQKYAGDRAKLLTDLLKNLPHEKTVQGVEQESGTGTSTKPDNSTKGIIGNILGSVIGGII